MELIPAIDLRGGRCVRLLQGHFDAETHYPGDPLELARAYHAQGAGRLHIVDLDGARDGTPANLDLISRLAALPGIALQVGGGVRSEDRFTALLAAGVARVVIGSLAVLEPHELRHWLERHDPDRIVLALDVRHDAAGRPMTRPYRIVRVGPSHLGSAAGDCPDLELDQIGTAARCVVQFVGPEGSKTGTIFVGDVRY